MRIKIVNVGDVQKEKSYFVIQVKYESDGKVQEKKFFSFNGDAYKTLKDATEGQVYDIKLEKDKNGYWQWAELSLLTAAAAAAASSGGSTNSRGFETPEERARRQVLIVRQSCLAQAIEFFKIGEEQFVVPERVVNLAEEFEKWVMRD